MDGSTSAAKDCLVVPVDVAALCVSVLDAQETAGTLAGATVTYQDQTTKSCPAPLWQNVNRGFTAPPLVSLEAGVHLHWALPDALTKASLTGNSLDFPVVPNRWLVTRLLLAGDSVVATSWVVVSDALSTTAPAPGSVTLAVAQVNSTEQNYRFLGRSFPLADYEPRRAAGSHATLSGLTGRGLTAVTTGVTSFAAYYPDCRGVLGFVDALVDVAGPARLHYVVTGWYADAGNDPAAGGADLAASHRWRASLRDAPPAETTLYSGHVQGVAWDPKRHYLPQSGQPHSQRPVTVEAALGSTPAEALAAYFRTQNHSDIPYFEKLLDALQAGLLPTLAQPAVDGMAALDEALHTGQFRAQDAGMLYAFGRTGDGESGEASEMPLVLAEALNRLNTLQEIFLAAGERRESFRWNFFTDWSRFFEATSDLTGPVFNHAVGQYARWSALEADLEKARQDVANQLATVQAMLDYGLCLCQIPAPRYWQPAEPALLLRGPEVAMASRYGGDGDHAADGTLAVRHGDELVKAVTVDGQAVPGSRYAVACALPEDKLPLAKICSDLLVEACLLETSLTAAVTHDGHEAELAAALREFLAGRAQTRWSVTAGKPPSPVGVQWWGPDNPWLPVFLQWQVAYAPLFPTQTGPHALADYDPRFFTANYVLDTTTGGFVTYAPGTRPGSIPIDPAKVAFSQAYTGASPLLRSSAQALLQDIEAILVKHPDPTLAAIRDQLTSCPTMVQPLAAFTDLLLMRQSAVQLDIAVAPGAPYQARTLTGYAAEVVGKSASSGPQFSVGYNPIRAGYFKVSGLVVDVFGQRRPLEVTSLAMAETLAAVERGTTIPDIAYGAPRLAQPARLLFRWLTSDAGAEIAGSVHSAMSPLVGWLVPDHVRRGFFLSDGGGRPLGALCLDGAGTEVLWQPAPGDDATIDLPVAEALAGANAVLRDFAVSWAQAAPGDFAAFCRALEKAHDNIVPGNEPAQGLPGLLAGRPIGLAQVGLRLEVRGEPARNQGWACLDPQQWTDTANGFDAVSFPVALGDLDRLSDGLLGYFKAAAAGYDYAVFYCLGAPAGATGRVIAPPTDTVLLQPSASGAGAATKLLLFFDPDTAIHAVTGILPTQTLQLPPDLVAGAQSALEVFFPATPVLRPAAGLALPLPAVPGYDIAWVQEVRDAGDKARWDVEPFLSPPPNRAVWAYTPQRLLEGWLRVNPDLLDFSLQNAAGRPVLTPGQVQSVRIRVTNRKPGDITFEPGPSVPEGSPSQGSILYLHFGKAVAQVDVEHLRLSAPGWRFQYLSDVRHGRYWSAVVEAATTLHRTESFDIAVADLKAASGLLQARIACDYVAIKGLGDGVCISVVAFQS